MTSLWHELVIKCHMIWLSNIALWSINQLFGFTTLSVRVTLSSCCIWSILIFFQLMTLYQLKREDSLLWYLVIATRWQPALYQTFFSCLRGRQWRVLVSHSLGVHSMPCSGLLMSWARPFQGRNLLSMPLRSNALCGTAVAMFCSGRSSYWWHE